MTEEEARKNLQAKRSTWLPAFELLLANIEIVPSALFALPTKLAEKGQPLLCAAIRHQCDLFATGDRRDFGHLYDQQIQGVEVVSLLRLAGILAEKGHDDEVG